MLSHLKGQTIIHNQLGKGRIIKVTENNVLEVKMKDKTVMKFLYPDSFSSGVLKIEEESLNDLLPLPDEEEEKREQNSPTGDGVFFHPSDKDTVEALAQALLTLNPEKKETVFVCVGSDLVIFDCFGPLVGTLLLKREIQAPVYGTFNGLRLGLVTAKNIDITADAIRQWHPNAFVVAIDAATAAEERVGFFKLLPQPLKPGAGAGKQLSQIGDVCVMGLTSEKILLKDPSSLNQTRLGFVYAMSERMVDCIERYLSLLQTH